jgi:hypothetical protein
VRTDEAIRSHCDLGARLRGTVGRCLPGAGGVAIIALGLLAWAVVNFRSPYHAWQYACGLRVTIEPTVVSIPEARVGEIRAAVVLVRNLTDAPVRVVGVTSTCTCARASDSMPLAVPAKGAKELHLTLDFRKHPVGVVEQRLVYYTDHPSVPRLNAAIVGRVIND